MTSITLARKGTTRSGTGLWFAVLFAAGVFGLLMAGMAAAYEFRYGDRIYEGVHSGGIQLGGMTMDEAAAALQERFTPFPSPYVSIEHGEQRWLLTSDHLGVAVDARATAAHAFRIGREGVLGVGSFTPIGALFRDLTTQLEAFERGRSIDPEVTYDETQVGIELRRIAQQVNLAPREGRLVISGLDVRSEAGQPGRLVDVDATQAAVVELVRAGQGGTVALMVQERQPIVGEVTGAADRARALLGRSIVAVAQSSSGLLRYAADPAIVSGWLTLDPLTTADGALDLEVSVDRGQVIEFLTTFAKQIDKPAYDARLDWDREAKQVIVLEPSHPGERLDLESGADAIVAALTDLPEEAAPTEAQIEVKTPVVPADPQVDSTKIAEMGIVEQVSEGSTYFKGSAPERVVNIQNAAGKFRGAVVPPGEVFSFNANVGDVTAANGFVDSLIIFGDRTEVGVGGGVCQVSTTVYRAAFWGGFPMVERHPHSYVVSWYGEPGMDASIFTPTADFKFKNDTGHFLLIQPEVDLAKGRLTFYFYGTKPARTVEMEKPVVTNRRPAPPPSYQLDKTLPDGKIKQVDWAKEGIDVMVKRIIRNADGTVKEEKIVSKYRPWQAVYLYGPGANVPGGN